jgi:hypothetical protein
MSRIPMPSPSGKNREGLFMPSRSGMALDAAPDEPTRRPSRALCNRAYERVLEECGRAAADEWWGTLFGPPDAPAEDLEEGETYAGEHQSREAVSKDGLGLPTYRRNGMPDNALAGDSSPRAIFEMMRRNIKIGPA